MEIKPPLRILVHLPTKGRKEQAQRTLEGYWSNASQPELLCLSLACNSETDVPGFGSSSIPLIAPFPSKIAAYNAVPLDLQWDILLAASDDMWCVQQDWDRIIQEAMTTHFPDTNGCLWFSDGRQDRICTFSIMGRKAYEEDGYVYHPEYLSFFCDNEWTDTWGSRNRLHRDQRCLFRNESYVWGGVMQEDATYRDGAGHKNFKWNHDKQLYYQRRIQGFPK